MGVTWQMQQNIKGSKWHDLCFSNDYLKLAIEGI